MIISCVYYIKHFLAKVLNFPSYVPKHTFLEANMAMNRLCSLKVWGTGGGVHRAYTYLEKECEGRRSCLLLRCTLESSGPVAEGTCLLASSSKHFAVSNAFVGSKVLLYEVLLLWLIPGVCNWWNCDFSRKEKSFLISNLIYIYMFMTLYLQILKVKRVFYILAKHNNLIVLL